MKKIISTCLLALLTLTASRVAAQTPKLPPAIYFDSQFVNFDRVYLDINNIDNISVVNGEDPILKTNGRVYMTLKQPFKSFLTLSAITARQQIAAKNILYVIDDQLLKDTTGVRIDPTFIVEVSTFDMSDVHYIQADEKKMEMMIIRTKAKPKSPDEKGTIRLRGLVSGSTTKIPPENQGE